MDSIRSRSRAGRARGRVRTAVAGAALLVAVGAGAGVGAKIYEGVHVWFSGDKVATVVHSGTVMHHPMGSDLRKAVAGATFPVVFPVGVPAGSRIDLVTLAPVDHPSMISLSYHDEKTGFKASFALVDPAVVSADGKFPPGLPAMLIRMKTFRHWRVGGELVAASDKLPAADTDRITAAMMKASPEESLAATETMLPRIRVLGGTVRVAIAEDLAPPGPNSVLLGDEQIRSIPSLVERHAPLADQRIVEATSIGPQQGKIIKAQVRPHHDVAVPASGVRAIDAVLRSADAHDRNDCGCEILYYQPDSSTYWVWKIPLAAPGAVKKYAVDATTFAVTPATLQ
jgi:hypothetical protein